MRKRVYFDNYLGSFWPAANELAPYFLARPEGSGWFHETGNDSAGLSLEGLDGTDQLPPGRGRKDISLSMWGNPELGVLLQYVRYGGGVPRQDWFSRGDLRKIQQWVRSLHNDPLPVGLFIPFDRAWLAVKEFMETEGRLPTSIEWVNSADLSDNTFPDPTVRLPGEAAGQFPRSLPFMFVFADFDSPTGYEAFAPNNRAQPRMRATYGVTVFIRRTTTSEKGYYVHSAWPTNRD